MPLRLPKPLVLPAATLALAAVTLASAEAAAAPPLRAEDGRFIDAAGRTVVLRGVNVAGNSKVPPFTGASDPYLFESFLSVGMNVVRLLFTWEAYEPVKGQYDVDYLSYYRSAVKAAGDAGLYVIVDFHQDGFSRGSIGGCGDGFPLWAIPADVTPAAPDNGPACKNWGVKMQSDKDMLSAWSAFYGDAEGVRTSYLAMLESVSTKLAIQPAVIGYDLLNEPWGDEPTEIGPLYEDAAAVVRKVSPDAIVFVSPHARTSAGSQTKLPKPSFGNVAYSPHFYDASVILFKSWSGVEPDLAFQLMNDTAAAWGAPLFLGEFGAPASTKEVNPYMRTLFRHMDDHLSSGTQWVHTPGWTESAKDGWNDEDFSIFDASGTPRDNFLLRCTPWAIAGRPTSFHVEPSDTAEAYSVELEWENDPAAGKTEVYAPIEAFEGAPRIVGTGEGLSCHVADFHVWCESSSAGPMSLLITMAPASEGTGGAGGGGGGAGADSGGCGCRTAGGAPTDRGAPLGVLLILGLCGVRRRTKGARQRP